MPDLTTLVYALLVSLGFRFLFRLLVGSDELPAVRETISLLLIFLVMYVSGCQPKKSATPPEPTILIATDTTRLNLLIRVNASGDTITIFHHRTQQSVTAYEKSVAHFDSIKVALP